MLLTGSFRHRTASAADLGRNARFAADEAALIHDSIVLAPTETRMKLDARDAIKRQLVTVLFIARI